MKTAQELYDISKISAQDIINEILDGVREHIIQKCEEKAFEGATYYTIHLKQAEIYVKDLLLEECSKIAKEFEDNGYQVSIKDYGNGYYINFCMTFSWGNEADLSKDDCLYNTNEGIIEGDENNG